MNTSNNKTAYNYHFLTREDVINLLEQKDMELKSKDVELKSKNIELEQKDAGIKVKDVELKQKDAELARKSQRILELERMVFGRRSEKRLPESPNGWAGSFFDKDWAKEGKQLSGEIPTIIKEVEKQAKQRREASRNARSTRKGKTYASYVPNDIERVVLRFIQMVMMKTVWLSSVTIRQNTCAYVPQAFMLRLKTASSAV